MNVFDLSAAYVEWVSEEIDRTILQAFCRGRDGRVEIKRFDPAGAINVEASVERVPERPLIEGREAS
jgi:hypothetical protein